MELSTGLALAPDDAANCVHDQRRTSVLVDGLRAALADVRRRFAPPIEIVYAGCGPLAPLVAPLLPDDDLRVTLIDVHDFDGVVVADATEYRHPRPIHIVITETMQRSLAKEPQVAIVRNLAPQLAPGGVLLPERVTVDLAFGTVDESGVTIRTVVGCAIELVDGDIRGHVVAIPEDVDGMKALFVTRVHVYGDHVLREFESGLTTPEVLWNFPRCGSVEFGYESSANPHITWRCRT